MRCRSSA